ncbi:HAD family phosphatase [Oxalobacteraceae bacterium OM1]|nr:HAD family phosphatase [Oxalobacteraceae bacterium OM1]
MARFELVAFDCDGVLVDTEPVTCGVLAAMLGELGWKLTTEEAMRIFVGRLVRDELPMIEANIGGTMPADFYTRFVERRNAALLEGVEPVRNIRTALDALVAHEVDFCVASGADRAKMHITLGQTGLLPLFEDKMFSGMEVARTKPAPDVYLAAARAFGADPARCVVIEDTPTGIAAGIAAGMTVYGYAERMDAHRLRDAGAVEVFDDMARLAELVL